ncbi:MAG: F0F1 ATP synthase subunit A [Chloroflexi bacterium]|nr:F0F1 ATP synthase subunit A [Chloroflexota bacterium]
MMLIFGSFVAFPDRCAPLFKLPGEVYPGTEGIPVLGGITNTFVSTVVAWIVVAILAFSLKARSRTADEIPTGFYNFFEMIIEAAYNFAEGIAGPKVKNFFPWFMTFILIILTTNWMGLIPGWDSIGFYEWKPHKAALDAEKEAKAKGLAFTEEDFHDVEHAADEANLGDLRVSPFFLIRADANAQEDASIEQESQGRESWPKSRGSRLDHCAAAATWGHRPELYTGFCPGSYGDGSIFWFQISRRARLSF